MQASGGRRNPATTATERSNDMTQRLEFP
ncbi:MAG: hypothetical protein QOK10_2520, partial [Pseudonocardiales bacterium]|nr:hypothetical protein [Pseudonocardiales bacterium]